MAISMRYNILIAAWLVTDLLIFIGSYVAAYFLRVGPILSTDFPFSDFIDTVLFIAPLWLIVLMTTRTFSLTRRQRTPRNIAYITYACVVGTALFTLGYYFHYSAFFSRLLLVYAMGISAGATLVWHLIFEQILRRVLRKDPPVFPTLIVGVTRESKQLVELLNSGKSPLKPVAILDGRGAKDTDIDGVPIRGKLNKLEEVLSEGITHLIQCSDLEQSLNLLSACRQNGITYMLLPSVLGIVERDERVESLEGQPVTMVTPKRRWWSWFLQ